MKLKFFSFTFLLIGFSLSLSAQIPEEDEATSRVTTTSGEVRPAQVFSYSDLAWEEPSIAFKQVDKKPLFPGCDTDGLEEEELRECSEKALLKYVYDNLEYPEEARLNAIEGHIVVSFTIGKDGTVSNPVVIHDIGGGCAEEGLRIVNAMPRWRPGISDGRMVSTRFNLPIKFEPK